MFGKRFRNGMLVVSLLAVSSASAAVSSLIEGTVMGTRPGNLFMMAGSGDHIEVEVPSTARVSRNGETVGLEELQPQDQVAVQLANDGKSATAITAHTRY